MPARGWSVDPRILAGAVAVFIVVAVALSIWGAQAPPALDERAPDTEFSAARALKHIEAFATEPHRAGTDANRRVRDYLVEAIRAMGGQPEVWSGTLLKGKSNLTNPENVIVRLPGTNPTKAFMLCAHYDSTPYGPGAADDGGGVAAMLETFRALKAGEPLRNDILLVFTDGEECGLLGARAFAELDERAKDVGLMLNFEARGTEGPSFLFETSRENGWIVREMAKAARWLTSSSLMFQLYIEMPTSSDYRVLKEHIPGMNAAFVGNLPYYHTPNDNPENISLASLQQHGYYALDFCRHFGDMDLTSVPKEPDAIYFNVFGRWFVHYPGSWNSPLAVLAIVAMFAVVVWGLVRDRLSPRGLCWGILAMLGMLLFPALVAGCGVGLAWAVRGIYQLYQSPLYMTSFVLLTVAVQTACFAWVRPRVELACLFAGALFWWAVVLVAFLVRLPGGAYLFTWPLLAGSAAFGLFFVLDDNDAVTPRRALLGALFALPALLLLVPSIYAAYLTGTAIFGPVLVLLIGLLGGMLLPLVEIMMESGRRWLPTASGALGLLCFLLALALGGFSAAAPLYTNLGYGMDADMERAYWISVDPEPNEWTHQFFPTNDLAGQSISEFGYGGEYWKSPAPMIPGKVPSVEVLEDRVEATGRTLRVRFTVDPDTTCINVEGSSESSLMGLTVQGQSLDISGKVWHFEFDLLPPGGIEAVLKTTVPATPLTLRVLSKTFAIPEFPGEGYTPMPDYMILEPNTTEWWRSFRSTQTIVKKTFHLDPPPVQ